MLNGTMKSLVLSTIVLIFMTFSGSALSSQENSTTLKDQAATATVWIYACCNSLSRPSIFVDSVEIARLGEKGFITLSLPPGRHEFDCDRPGNDPKKIDLKPGTITYLKVEFGWTKTRLKLVSELQSTKESKGFAEVEVTSPRFQQNAKPQTLITSEPRFTKDKVECPFTRISPIPEGKAVIYLYKDGYGRQPSAISVNEKIVVVIKNKGYYPMVVEPGEYAFETGSGFGWAPMGHPVNRIRVEAGKEYFLEYLTRFSGSFKEVDEKQGLNDLKKLKLQLPFKMYDFTEDSYREVIGKDELRELMVNKRRGKTEVIEFREVSEGYYIGVPVTFKTRFWLLISGPIGTTVTPVMKKTYHEYRTVHVQWGFAKSCDDKGVFGNP